MIRILDLALSITALLVLLPLFLPIILILKFTGEGEIFYAQERIGKNNKTFRLIKFATMLKNSPNMKGGTITISEDPRILPFGRLLRKTKINELPQLINVLSGDMSLIGPRPMVRKNFGYYSPYGQKIISSVRPGLSGIGSIIYRNEEELLNKNSDRELFYKQKIAPHKENLEIWFVKKYSLKLYLLAIFATILVILYKKSDLINRIYTDLPRE